MHSKFKRSHFVFVLFFEAGGRLAKAKANQLMYLLSEQTACEINKTWTKQMDKTSKTSSLLSIMYRHCQNAITEKQLLQRKQILFTETDFLLNDKITHTL